MTQRPEAVPSKGHGPGVWDGAVRGHSVVTTGRTFSVQDSGMESGRS